MRVQAGFVPEMKVDGMFYVNEKLQGLALGELEVACERAKASGGGGGFLPAVKQIANVAALPGVVGHSVGLPDVHSGYGFAIGNVAAFDMDDPDAIVSPGGVGFDINCGVRLIRTNLSEEDVAPIKEQLTQSLFDHIPVGVGSQGIIPTTAGDLNEALEMGMDWSLREGYAWAEDKEHWYARARARQWPATSLAGECKERSSQPALPCARALSRSLHATDRDRRLRTRARVRPASPTSSLTLARSEEYGRMLTADPNKVSTRAKKRGLPQMGTLGAGNHYAEVQVVDEIYDERGAGKMGIDRVGQVVVMLHSGSRGLGHQVATDALTAMERAMKRDGIAVNDRQLACARIGSQEGQDYLASMAAAANYAWVNRSSMTFLVRQAFAKAFKKTPDDLDMHVIYDVSHNIAKMEEHVVNGERKRLLVHRKGSTRAFPPHHPLIPVDYQLTGQPVLIGGTMGTCSYVLTGTEKGMRETFGSTCHGAGRAQSRNKSRHNLDYTQVLDALKAKGISIRVASPKLVMEEAPESYKDVTAVVDTCHDAGISKKCVRLRPIAVVKG